MDIYERDITIIVLIFNTIGVIFLIYKLFINRDISTSINDILNVIVYLIPSILIYVGAAISVERKKN